MATGEEGAGKQLLARFLFHGHRFARKQGFVEFGGAVQHNAVSGHLLPGRKQENVVENKLGHGNFPAFSLPYHARGGGGENG